MHTQREPTKPVRFIVLIPHRDTGKLLDEYRRRLFAAGFPGARSFPAAAPLAELSGPLSREELKEFARNIRSRTKKDDGKILYGGTAFVPCRGDSGRPPGSSAAHQNRARLPEGMAFFGPVLNLPAARSLLPGTAKDKVVRDFFPAVLCAALTLPGEVPALSLREEPGETEARDFRSGRAALEIPPYFDGGFRAAALANLAIRPLPGGAPDYSHEWKIGPPVWLPAK